MSSSDKLTEIAEQFVRAAALDPVRSRKEGARLRRTCTLKEWELVLAQAKRIHTSNRNRIPL